MSKTKLVILFLVMSFPGCSCSFQATSNPESPLPDEAEDGTHYEIVVNGEKFATVESSDDMKWDCLKEGWWVNKTKWLPATVPFQVEQYPIE